MLFILGFTGFFLDHKNWSFLYTVGFESVPASVFQHEKRLIEAYWVNADDESDIVVGSRRGVFQKSDGVFVKVLERECLALKGDGEHLYAATDDGLYRRENGQWKPYALGGHFINALAVSDNELLLSSDKKTLFLLDKQRAKVLLETGVSIPYKELVHDISLSRFVRDLHYGRGLFEGVSSLLINDYGALFLLLLSLSGYLVYLFIKLKKYPQCSRSLIRLHANIFAIIALVPLSILLITGIFLDHPKGLANFMRSVKIPHAFLPPVYSSLKEDVWSVDLYQNRYRIGNRYGVYESDDLVKWSMTNKGFAYRMKRIDEKLYISGMGAPNRILHNGKYEVLLNTPHMFKDINLQKGEEQFFSSMSKVALPQSKDTSLYAILLALHDGTFFSSWWVWVNDIAAALLFVLGVTGTIRYLKKKRLL